MSLRPDLILCLAANYGLKQIEPFIASWRRHMPAAKLVMYCANMDAAFHEAAAQLGVTVLDAGPGLASPYHPQTARYFMYRDYLTAHGQDYASVLICDVRDVVFQGDVFAVSRDAPVWFAAEDQVLGACHFNTAWLVEAYGEAVAEALAGETISCSGTTFGEASAVADYVALVCQQAEQHPQVASRTGMDQGFHNYILWRLQPPFIALDRQDRAVNTVGYTPPNKIVLESGRILVDGVASPVVHQWDRHPAVQAEVQRLYTLDATLAA